MSKYLINEDPVAMAKGAIIEAVEGVEKHSERVRIRFIDGGYIELLHHHHHQDCCVAVALHDFEGDPEELSGAIVQSFEISESDATKDPQANDESATWTFYKLETSKGGLWLRWLGESNGFFSEAMSAEVTDDKLRLRVSDDGVVSAYEVPDVAKVYVEPLAQMEFTDADTLTKWATAVARLH